MNTHAAEERREAKENLEFIDGIKTQQESSYKKATVSKWGRASGQQRQQVREENQYSR
jgi:hypothetical protein